MLGAGIAPYVALELTLFDTLPTDLPPFARGFCAALVATTACYPLDTIRQVFCLYTMKLSKGG